MLPEPTTAGDRGVHSKYSSIAASELVAVEDPNMNGMTRLALAAVAVVAVVVGGLVVLRPGDRSVRRRRRSHDPPCRRPRPRRRRHPLPSPVTVAFGLRPPPEPSVAAMTQTIHLRPRSAMRSGIPLGWIVTPLADAGPTPGRCQTPSLSAAGELDISAACPRGHPGRQSSSMTGSSRPSPNSNDPKCMPPRNTLGIGDHRRPRGSSHGLLWKPARARRVEATVVVVDTRSTS